MAIDKATQPNVDLGDLTNFPNGRIKDNDGTGDGTPVNRTIYSDIHETFAKLMRMAGITYNGVADSTANGYQLVQALQALAGKNAQLYTLTSDTTTVVIQTKIGVIQNGEFMLCKSAFNYGTEAVIIGNESTPITKTLTVSSSFKTNDYLLLVMGSGGVTLVRLATADNLDVLITALSYLKAASDAEAIAGSITTKAVTPHALKAAFLKWVNDATGAAPFLATDSLPGIMSASDKTKLDALSSARNIGWVSGLDPGGGTVGSHCPAGGGISDCVITTINPAGVGYGAETLWTVTVATPMDDELYYVRMAVESQGDYHLDDNILTPVFKPISTTQFQIAIQEVQSGAQSLKIYLEVIQFTS